MKRKCYICKKVKDISEFTKDKSKTLGRAYRCYPCQRKRFNDWWETEEGKKYKLKHRHISRGNERRSELKYPEKDKARATLREAVKKGLVKRLPCHCGEIKSQGHHEDYSKPLNVIWLCAKHHKQLHREQKNLII